MSAPALLPSNYSSHGFVLSVLPFVNCFGVQGWIAPNTALGRAQFRIGIAQIVVILLIVIVTYYSNKWGRRRNKLYAKQTILSDIVNNSPDTVADDVNRLAQNSAEVNSAEDRYDLYKNVAGFCGATLFITTLASMFIGVVIGTQGNYGRGKEWACAHALKLS